MFPWSSPVPAAETASACCGGLARLKAAGPGRLWVAHFNHALRGADSDADEQFTARLAEQLGLGYRGGRAAPGELAATEGHAAGRQARYRFLQATAEAVGARYVITAHTADDQAETILHRILRGTGLAGLAGMRRARPLSPAVSLLRPLLEVRREEIRDYLRDRGQAWREDASNESTDPTRNWIRHELLSRIVERVNPRAGEAIIRLGFLAEQAQAVVELQAAELVRRAIAVRTVGIAGNGFSGVRLRQDLAPAEGSRVRNVRAGLARAGLAGASDGLRRVGRLGRDGPAAIRRGWHAARFSRRDPGAENGEPAHAGTDLTRYAWRRLGRLRLPGTFDSHFDRVLGRGRPLRFVLVPGGVELDGLVAADRPEIEDQQQVAAGHGGWDGSCPAQGHPTAVDVGFFDFSLQLVVAAFLDRGDLLAVEPGDGGEE